MSKVITAALMLLVLLPLSCAKKAGDVSPPVLGTGAVKDVSMIEDPALRAAAWKGKGLKGITIVRAGAHRDLASEYLRPMADSGIVKKVYWIIPLDLLGYWDAERRIKQYLSANARALAEEEIGGLRLDGGCVSGRLLKTEVSICSPETFRPPAGPVVLDMGADFFPVFAATKDESVLRGLREFFNIMSSKGLRVLAANAAPSTGHEAVLSRYLAEQVSEGLKDPELLRAPQPPELWSARDSAATMVAGKRYGEVLEGLKKPLLKYPDDPTLLLFNCLALAHSGREEAALEALSSLCGRNRAYCPGLTLAGNWLKAGGKAGPAEKFLKKAEELGVK